MNIPIYQIDAFAKNAFEGNPAAICPLDTWLPDELLLSIAEENNLSETAYFIKTNEGYHIRWFTPVAEVDLCGHATLAAAFVIFNELGYTESSISFESKSGILKVEKDNDLLIMDFPSQPPTACELPTEIQQAFDAIPVECLQSEDYLLVFNTEDEILNAKPKLELLKNIDLRGVIITAPSEDYDFVSRFFAPKYGINEDPATGSAHTKLVPYWANQLNQTKFHAKQVSKRGGELFCELTGERVTIAGYATKFLQGSIEIDY